MIDKHTEWIKIVMSGSKLNGSKFLMLIGPFRLGKFFLGILSVIGGPKGTVSKKLKKNFFEPEGHFRTFFRKIFLSTMTIGKFYVDPEILSP